MVRVGVDTLPRRMTGLPAITLSLAVVMSASAAAFAGAPGAPCGHKFSVRCPGAGCQAGFCAARLAERSSIAARKETFERISEPLREIWISGVTIISMAPRIWQGRWSEGIV